MKTVISVAFALLFFSQLSAQTRLLVCEDKKGCFTASTNIPPAELEQLFQKPGLLSGADSNSILLVVGCDARVDQRQATNRIHRSFAGQGAPANRTAFDLRNHLTQKACVGCPNTSKRISFRIETDEMNGESYFFANLKKGEAYMPNAAHHMLYRNQEGFGAMTIDAFLRNKKYTSYVIDPEGKKYEMSMPIGTDMKMIDAEDLANQEKFKKHFRVTGQKRPHLNTGRQEIEYVGEGDEGTIRFWLSPSADVCLPAGQFDALGFFNLGYLAIDGITYLVCEISGSGFRIQLTGIEEGSYQFNTAGYTPLSTRF